jgi:hypothetical protein
VFGECEDLREKAKTRVWDFLLVKKRWSNAAATLFEPAMSRFHMDSRQA